MNGRPDKGRSEFCAKTPRTVYLVRHAKPFFPGGARLCIGRLDPVLSVKGITQGKKLAGRFDGVSLTGVYASPQRRALETALLLSSGRWPVTAVDGLQELDIGVWEGKTFDEIREFDGELWRLRGERPDLYWPKGSEPPAEGLKRFKKAFYALLERTRGDIAVVAHSGVNRIMTTDLLGMEPSRMFDNTQQYCGVCVLRFLGPEVEVTFEDSAEAAGVSDDPNDTEK